MHGPTTVHEQSPVYEPSAVCDAMCAHENPRDLNMFVCVVRWRAGGSVVSTLGLRGGRDHESGVGNNPSSIFVPCVWVCKSILMLVGGILTIIVMYIWSFLLKCTSCCTADEGSFCLEGLGNVLTWLDSVSLISKCANVISFGHRRVSDNKGVVPGHGCDLFVLNEESGRIESKLHMLAIRIFTEMLWWIFPEPETQQ